MDNAAAIAFNRFGLGRRMGEPVPSDPKAWLRGQLAGADPALSAGSPGGDTSAALGTVREQIDMRRERKEAIANAAQAGGMGKPLDQTQASAGATAGQMVSPVAVLAKQEIHAFLGNALVTASPFRERLVWFWTNHFTIAAKTAVSAACCGAYVREAIRPHVTGRFADMLLAVMRHPAMISYLNQERSAGPASIAGLRHHIGLNENLARECLELHTLSPASGYTQQDVTNFARILTGWSIDLQQEPRGFRFRPNLHEPGTIEVMGRSWPEGEQGGLAFLAWLGTHPATYHHLATKLVRHFVADVPPAADVRRIEAVLRQTDGDLGAASAALIDLPDAWTPEAKLRTPQEFAVACLRAVGSTPDQVPNLPQIMGGLGQPMFQAPFPIGWPDQAADWSGPEAMLERVDFVYGLSGRAASLDPLAIGHETLGPLLSAGTLAAASRRRLAS